MSTTETEVVARNLPTPKRAGGYSPRPKRIDIVRVVIDELNLLSGVSDFAQKEAIRLQVEKLLRVSLHIDPSKKQKVYAWRMITHPSLSDLRSDDPSVEAEEKIASAFGIDHVGLVFYLGGNRVHVVRLYTNGENGNTQKGLAGMLFPIRSCEWLPTRERLFPKGGEINREDGFLTSIYQAIGNYGFEIPVVFKQCKHDRDSGNDSRIGGCFRCRWPEYRCPYQGMSERTFETS